MATGVWGANITLAVETLNLSLKAKTFSQKVQLILASNTPIMTEKLDEKGNLVKDPVTGKTIKVPLVDEETRETVYNLSKEDAKNATEAIENSVKQLEEANKAEGKLLASKLYQLQQATTGLYERIIASAVAIIGTCPVGPTFSPQLLMPLIQAITGEAQNLSSIYDEVEDKMKKLQLDEEGIQNAQFEAISIDEENLPSEARPAIEALKPLLDTINAVAGEKLSAAIKTITLPIYALLKVAETTCAICGAACGKAEAKLETPSVENPNPLEAKDCTNYTSTNTSYYNQHPDEKHAKNCSKFEHRAGYTGSQLTDDEYVCDNCKYFKK